MKTFVRGPKFALVIDQNSGTQIELDRNEAKELARFLMVELAVVDALLIDGRNLLDFDEKFAKLVRGKHSMEDLKYAVQKAEQRRIRN